MNHTIIYLYDYTFKGLLTALSRALSLDNVDPKNDGITNYNNKTKSVNKTDKDVKIVPEGSPETCELFAEYHKISTSEQTYQQAKKQISQVISRSAYRKIYWAYLSEAVGIETLIYRYVNLGLEMGAHVDELLSHKEVHDINKIIKQVSRERHRMLGFLRFKQLSSGIFYAPMESECDVLTLIAPHFQRRLSDQSWIIEDKKREQCALYNQSELIFAQESFPEHKIEVGEEEKEFQNLWKKYYRHITITERKNRSLQKQNMPKKYWKYLSEKQQ